MTQAQTQTFQRTPFAYTAYASMLFFGVMIALPGAAMPFVAERLSLSYGLTGWHFSLAAAGGLIVGVGGERVTAWLGNQAAVQLSAVLAVVGMFGLVYGGALWVTLPGILLAGVGTAGVATFVTAAIVDAYPLVQARALTEGNIYAGSGVAIGPLLVGLFAWSGLGWQSAVWVVLAACVVLQVALRRANFPKSADGIDERQSGDETDTPPLPSLFWLFAVILFLGVSVEWLLFYWSPGFLETFVGFEQSTAAALISVQAVAIVIGRLVGRRLLERFRTGQLLLGAFVLILAVLPVYLLSPFQWLTVTALFVLGLGIGNLFPLSLSGAMAAGGTATARASARVSVFGSAAMLIMPNILGNLADAVGLRAALWMVAVVAVIAISIVLTAQNRQAQRRNRQTPQPDA